jgi:hypothetical protein
LSQSSPSSISTFRRAAGKSRRATGIFGHDIANHRLDGKFASKQANFKTGTNDAASLGKFGYKDDECAAVGDIVLNTASRRRRQIPANILPTLSPIFAPAIVR